MSSGPTRVASLKRPKTEAGARAVPLFPSVEAAFRALEARAFERGRAGLDELVFATARGTPLHESNVNRRVWRPAVRRAAELLRDDARDALAEGDRGRAEELEASAADLELASYRWHDLRHTTVSRLVADCAEVNPVQSDSVHVCPLEMT